MTTDVGEKKRLPEKYFRENNSFSGSFHERFLVSIRVQRGKCSIVFGFLGQVHLTQHQHADARRHIGNKVGHEPSQEKDTVLEWREEVQWE